ncbi:ribosome 60S biogenesis N-terminal-domain-containing protein [Aspergillus caelatus]|uniref:Ribosome 60S biogenesis N-terminal-domain-containing protein n=1 Tax=Aspergillus caelatus TaxID=61420 RepID=A0A5N6ZVW7_9EURO|nr:ribosome 60S biogenesis N-terminal-domain-containing protein [Aspergillus caelatus]KAE8361652.1 ribosome 60S biogenesis N-terminal-domain-containing protein [Aspergillus caelatus]
MSPHDDQLHRNKRRKVDSAQENDAPTDITSHGQLRNLLTFQQNVNEVKQGIKKFKEFLLATGQTENEGEKAKKFRILKAYCDSQISHEEEPSCFPDLIQTWNFADSNNNESLLTVVPSVLALFIKTVSTNLDFREFGLALCKFLLKKEQLRFFNRGLTATKSKEHLISPCLRLLTEIVSFDGGAVARHVYAVRYITFKRIEVFLTPNKSQLEEASDDSQKSTLRRNAQRYVLANLRFQHASAKSDIIEQYKVIRAFLEYVRKDPRDTVLDIIRAIERDIVQDTSLSRNAKTKFFNRGNLEKLVTLYGYDRESEEPNPTGVSIASEIHKILMNVCTNSSHGVLLSETSWYPNGSDPESLPGEEDTSIDLGLDSAVYVDKYRESVPVRNGILSYLAQTLRPDADSLQIELLVAIFKEAPELVADFFTKKTMFVSDPRPTSSWMAESALLFSTVSLPVPTNFGWKDKLPSMPPPVSVVIENILPRPLSQKTLTRCLNLNAEIITLFAVRILTISFNKLRKVLRIFNSDHGVSQSFWTQAKGKLIAEFCRRCPSMKDVVSLYKKTAKEDLQQQEAVAELLACFYEIVPDVAFEETFDVSLVLVDILKRLDESSPSEEDSESLLAQLGSILKIAQQSASMRWWQQPGSMQFSAFTSILKVVVGASSRDSLKDIEVLLKTVLTENSVLQDSGSYLSLVSSFETSDSGSLHHQLSFFDNCVCRVAKKPVHYQDLLGSLCEAVSKPVSPIVAAITEQWPFVVKSGGDAESAVGAWIAKILGKLKGSGEDSKALKAARDTLVAATENKRTKSTLKKALKDTEEGPSQDSNRRESSTTQPTTSRSNNEKSTVDLEEIFGTLPTEGTTHNALHRWEKEDIEISVEQGRVADLMLCLCSEHEEVRRQAFANITRFMSKIRESKYVEWRSVFLLTGELLETVKQIGLESPVPWIVGECASNCLAVLVNPMHKLYGKVNKFLQKSPSWEPEKIPSYWIDKILLHEPELDDGYFEETNWLLDLLIKGLRTETDMGIYRRANVFERALSFYESPGPSLPSKRKILHLLYRSTQVQGSTTLITRAGIVSWIQSQIPALGGKEVPTFTAMAFSLYESSEQDRVMKWSGGSVAQVVENIAV